MRKGFTLIEMLIVVIISSVIILYLTSVYASNYNVFNTITYEKGVNDYLKNSERMAYDMVADAEEIYLLDSVPATFEDDYSYIYSKDGEVYYKEKLKTEISITENAEEEFEIVFTKKSNKLLNIEINSISKSNNSKETDVKLRNELAEIYLDGSSDTSNIIKFNYNLPEQIELEIVVFKFEKSENINTDKWLLNKYEGTINQDTSNIVVEVDEEVDLSQLKATIEHNAGEIKINGMDINLDTNMTSDRNIDFRDTVNVELSRNSITKNYTVSVVKKGSPLITYFSFRAHENSTPLVGNWIGERNVIPDAGADNIGYIKQEDRKVLISMDTIAGSNQFLKPYIEIIGDYIVIDGKELGKDIEGTDGRKMIEYTVDSGIDFNPGRTFSNYEMASSYTFTGSAINFDYNQQVEFIYGDRRENEYRHIKPTIATVYATAVDGSIREKSYEIYVSPYGIVLGVKRVDAAGNTVFDGYVDESNITVYMPDYGDSTDRYEATVFGNASNFYSSGFWNVVEIGKLGPQIKTGLAKHEAGTRKIERVAIHNQDVYDRMHSNIRTQEGYETDKFYKVSYKNAGIFEFYYENTEVDNRYLFQEVVSGEIIQGDSQKESTIGKYTGSNTPTGEINITFPQNEYLEDMVATFKYMGEYVNAVNDKGDDTLQNSTVTSNKISGDNIKEYYARSQVSTGSGSNGDNYNRYEFNVIYSDAPKISFNDNNLIIASGTGNDAVLQVPKYNYEKGINRNEDVTLAKYEWYFTENNADVGSDLSKPLNVEGEEFKVSDNLSKIQKTGYVFCKVTASSETYTIKEDITGYKYGGVKTDPIYTTGYEVVKPIGLDYVIWGNEKVTLNSKGSIGGETELDSVVHSNKGLDVEVEKDLKNITLESVESLSLVVKGDVENVTVKSRGDLSVTIEGSAKNVTLHAGGSLSEDIKGSSTNVTKITGPVNVQSVSKENVKLEIQQLKDESIEGIVIIEEKNDIFITNPCTLTGLIYSSEGKVSIKNDSINMQGGIYGDEIDIQTDGDITIR